MAESDKYSLLLSFQDTDNGIVRSYCNGAEETNAMREDSISTYDAATKKYIGYSHAAVRLIKDLYRGYKLRRP